MRLEKTELSIDRVKEAIKLGGKDKEFLKKYEDFQFLNFNPKWVKLLKQEK